MPNTIQYFHGTQAAYDLTQTKLSNALYFITDTERVYKGSELVAANNVKVVTTMPDVSEAIEGMIYIHAETSPKKTSIKVINSDKSGYTTVASSDSLITASSVTEFTNKTIDAENNTITNLLVSNFNSDAISTTIPAYNSDTHAGKSNGYRLIYYALLQGNIAKSAPFLYVVTRLKRLVKFNYN